MPHASSTPAAGTVPDDWENRAREVFLDGDLGRTDELPPPGEDPAKQLLSVFELEKTVYELRYERNNRPEWVALRMAGIARLRDS